MPKYQVKVEVSLGFCERTVEVEANDEAEAKDKALECVDFWDSEELQKALDDGTYMVDIEGEE